MYKKYKSTIFNSYLVELIVLRYLYSPKVRKPFD